jgi:hypothetical protein
MKDRTNYKLVNSVSWYGEKSDDCDFHVLPPNNKKGAAPHKEVNCPLVGSKSKKAQFLKGMSF